MPLDPVPRDICVEFVAGSHRWGRWFRPQKFSGVAYDHKSDTLEDMPDIGAHRPNYRLLSWDVELGDAIAFTSLTIHGAPGNLTSGRRRPFASPSPAYNPLSAHRPHPTSP